ncbi:MAG: hypothetical protein PHQ23_03815 [Candidatus Wallbacteria bacterium]|nr:hypothetical protein [Candidatus Wallbacteria bacterium]
MKNGTIIHRIGREISALSVEEQLILLEQMLQGLIRQKKKPAGKKTDLMRFME